MILPKSIILFLIFFLFLLKGQVVITSSQTYFTRVYIWATNTDDQCGQDDFSPAPIEVMQNPIPPKNVSVKMACSTEYNAFFRTFDDRLFATGNYLYIGVDGLSSDQMIPLHIPLGDIEFGELRCFDKFACMRDPSKNVSCWGKDSDWGLMGYGKVVHPEPKTIMKGNLEGTTVVNYQFSLQDGVALVEDDGGAFHFYSIGYSYVLGDGSGLLDATEFEPMDDALFLAEIGGGNNLKRLILLNSFAYALFEDGKMFFWGFAMLHTATGCSNLLNSIYYSPVAYPAYASCVGDTYTSQLVGGVVKDLVCSEDEVGGGIVSCVAIVDHTGTIGLFSWGGILVSGDLFLGRNYGATDAGKVARAVDDTAYSGETIKKLVATHYAIFLQTELNGVERLYAFGSDSKEDMGGAGDVSYFIEMLTDVPWKKKFVLFEGTRGVNPIVIFPGQCFGIFSNETEVCSNRGECVDYNVCECIPELGYDGLACNESGSAPSCNNTCSGRGDCVNDNECECTESDFYGGNDCELRKCWGELETSDNVCNQHGNCTAVNGCECELGYVAPRCFGDDGGGGGGDIGDFFKENLEYVIPISSGVVLAVLGLFLCMCCIIFCVCCCCCCFAIFFPRKKNVDSLDQFDLIANEEDQSIAHLNINEKLFEIPIKEIEAIKILGQGGSNSIVYKAKWRKKIVAFKCFKTRQILSDQDVFDEFEKEVKILGSLSHPGILQFYGATLNPPKVGIIMEFCAKGDFSKFLVKYRKETGDSYPIDKKIKMFQDIADVMSYLHDRKVIHRDLKMENVLITAHEEIKVMDFGLSRIVERASQIKTTRIGTSSYMSPELVNGVDYDNKVDVFSYGILVYVAVTENTLPYGDISCVELKVANNPNFRPKLEKMDAPEYLKEICENCWQEDPKKRKSFAEIINEFGKNE